MRSGGEREREMGTHPHRYDSRTPTECCQFYEKKKYSAKTHIYLSEMKYGLKLRVPSVQLYLDIVLISCDLPD